MLKKIIKKRLGEALKEYRNKSCIRMQIAAEKSRLNWQQIDTLESGCDKNWYVYERLLEVYNKDFRIELVDKRTG